jgi:hypothetical protein
VSITSEVQTVSIAVASASVVAGVIYYIFQIRHQTRTRQTELVTRLASTFARKEFQQELWELLNDLKSGAFHSESDIVKKYGSIYPETAYFFEELGVLLKRKLVDISLVDDLFSAPIIRFWEAAKPFVERARKQLNEPQYAEHIDYLYNEMKKRERKLGQSKA